MNTIAYITLAELYEQQYPIILTSNGESHFLQETDDGLGFNLEDDKGHIKESRLRKDSEYSVSPQGVITICGKTYRILIDQKNQPSPKLTRNIVTAYLSKPNDESDLTPDDRIHIFKTILAGSSDVTLDLFKDVCSEYDLIFDHVIEQELRNFYDFAMVAETHLFKRNGLDLDSNTKFALIIAPYSRFAFDYENEEYSYEKIRQFVTTDKDLLDSIKAHTKAGGVNLKQFKITGDYDFYRFTSLVKDLIIHKNNMSIPYDIEHEIISAAYARFQYQDIDMTPYDEQVKFIQSDSDLMLALINANENKQRKVEDAPASPTVPTVPVFETKRISWEGLGHVCDFLLDHDEDKYTLAELKTSSNEHLEFEVLPDNRVIMKGQIYTPVALTTVEVYSL